MKAQLEPLGQHVGAEISGVDLTALRDDEVEFLRDALGTHGVLLFRDQRLSPPDHIAFARRWGELAVNPYFAANAEFPEIAEVRKAEDQQTNIGGGWHTDHSYDAVPAMGSILVARELPPRGGDTLFASMSAAFEALSDGLKQALRGLRAVHATDHIFGPEGYLTATDQAENLKGRDEQKQAIHPVVIRHPTTGREILYVNPGFTIGFEGWTREESVPLLHHLFGVAMREEFHCRVEWRPGSVAMWDNRSTWHNAVNDYHGHRRLMHRVTVAGERLH